MSTAASWAARRVAVAAWRAASPHVRDAVAARRARRHDVVRALEVQRRAQQQHAAAVARRDRLVARSRRSAPRLTAVSAVAAVATVPVDGGLSVALGTVAVAAGARAAVAARRVVRPPAVPPPPPLLPPPVGPRSAAYPVVHRLDRAREALGRLLPLVPPPGREPAEEAWQAAAGADAALRWQAARLAAVEPYADVAPLQLAELEAGARQQEALVRAVADLVSASTGPYDAARLQDVADRLHGLAAGLREVR